MGKSESAKVNAFLRDLQAFQPSYLLLIDKVRALFLNASKRVQEDVKYGGIVFNLDGSLIGGVFAYQQHVSIEFSQGAQFIDENALLEGKGKLRRHLKLVSDQDLADKNAAAFIRQAIQLK